jgi:protein-S-isoprenylcysteine O-methyltransferase Ste14
MTLRHSIEAQGNWLFKRRGLLPLLILPLFVAAVGSVESSENAAADNLELWYQLAGLTIAFVGLMLRAYTVGTAPRGTSGRNIASQEASTLNTTGMYSIVRHPLYLGNYLILLGCAIFTGSVWLPVVTSLMFWPYYERIAFAEEEYLLSRFGELFTEWADRTPAFLPRFPLWQPPVLAFSWRTVLKREYGAFLTILAVCSLSEVYSDLIFDPHPHLETAWAAVLVVAVVVALTLRWLKRRTTLLNVEGRP